MALDVYRRYAGENPEELRRNLIKILLASAYMAAEEAAPVDAPDLPERFESGRTAARAVQTFAREHGLPGDAAAGQYLIHLRESFGFDIGERLIAPFAAPLAGWDLAAAIDIIERHAGSWHTVLVRVFAAKEELIELKNQRLAEICDVHVGELKIITTFKHLSNGKLYDKRTEVEELLRQIRG